MDKLSSTNHIRLLVIADRTMGTSDIVNALHAQGCEARPSTINTTRACVLATLRMLDKHRVSSAKDKPSSKIRAEKLKETLVELDQTPPKVEAIKAAKARPVSPKAWGKRDAKPKPAKLGSMLLAKSIAQ